MRLAAVAVAAASTLACSGEDAPSHVAHATGPTDVVLQVGSYDIGQNIDGFVTAPSVVVYGDGTVLGYVQTGTDSSGARFGLRRGRMTEDDIQILLRAAAEVPADAELGSLAVDARPLLVVAGGHRWELGELRGPVLELAERIQAAARLSATESWEPEQWIQRPYGEPCTVLPEPDAAHYYTAPVFPAVVGPQPVCP